MNILSLSFPSRFSPYISILRTYIKPSSDLSSPSKNERQSAEHRIAQSVISILYNTIPVATDPDTKLLNAIEQDLILHMNKGLHQIINVAVPCLCNIVIKTTKHYFIIENVHRKCLG